MHTFPFLRTRDTFVTALAVLVALNPLTVWSAPPVIDNPVPVNGENFPTQVEPRIPIGKALIFPITASDPDGGPLKYKVTSDNPKITVSVRTALPKLKIQVDHVGNGTPEDPAFSGELQFAMLRDIAPLTVHNIAGFAQGRYYNYNGDPAPNFRNQILHRIADLDENEEPDGSFIIQGGDPSGSGLGGPGFQYENEFHASALFVGRGQLAMANAGINATTNKATNGSQFFITLGQPRFLDFNHTIFGQLLRGWDLIETIADVPRNSSDKPLVDIKLTSAVVEQNFSDAILLLSATAPGTGKIKVTVTDANGEEDIEEFTVTAYKDTRNTPPFLRPVPNQSVETDKILGIPLSSVDLESDFAFTNHGLLDPKNGRTSGSGSTAFVLGNSGYTGPLNLGISITQFDMTYRGDIDGDAVTDDDKIAIAVAVGDKQINAVARNLGGVPGAPLPETVIASYVDGDPAAQPSDFTARVIWGDGSFFVVPDGGTPGDGRFPCTITRDTSSPLPGAFLVSATHIYQNAGIYPVTIELTAAKGQRATLRTTAVITPGTVRAYGKNANVKGKTAFDGLLATFTDASLSALTNYSARVHWGDGSNSEGVIKRTRKGDLEISGTHTFPSEGEYAVVVELTKTGDPNPPAIAWSRVEITGIKGPPVLPPYPTPNLVGQMGDAKNIGAKLQLVRSGNQTSVAAQLIIVNGGSKATKAGKLRFYLSEDKVTNLQDETGPDPENPGNTIVLNPKDMPVKIGTLKEVKVQGLPPGAGVRYVFDKTSQGDFRLKFPVGESGLGLNILAHFEYTDPLGDNMPIPRDVAVGPFDPFIVVPQNLEVKESGGENLSKKFSVKLAREPRANVVIPITLDSDANKEITVSATSLTFTPANWSTEQEVTVTAKEDTTSNSPNVFVVLGRATSTDMRFKDQKPANVRVTVKDKDSN
jgi:cyclophilin family peptidyl-prolyl cis-trans isomerase